jgi:hypothetical protein
MTLDGALVCQVGPFRFALAAHDVSSIEVPDARGVYAGRWFGLAAGWPENARSLRSPGHHLVVDAVEVHGEALQVLAVPAMVASPLVTGFVELHGALVPVVTLAQLAERRR